MEGEQSKEKRPDVGWGMLCKSFKELKRKVLRFTIEHEGRASVLVSDHPEDRLIGYTAVVHRGSEEEWVEAHIHAKDAMKEEETIRSLLQTQEGRVQVAQALARPRKCPVCKEYLHMSLDRHLGEGDGRHLSYRTVMEVLEGTPGRVSA